MSGEHIKGTPGEGGAERQAVGWTRGQLEEAGMHRIVVARVLPESRSRRESVECGEAALSASRARQRLDLSVAFGPDAAPPKGVELAFA